MYMYQMLLAVKTGFRRFKTQVLSLQSGELKGQATDNSGGLKVLQWTNRETFTLPINKIIAFKDFNYQILVQQGHPKLNLACALLLSGDPSVQGPVSSMHLLVLG